MAYQETKTTNYGTRISNSFKGIGTGFILLIVGTALLWWNEGRAVKTTKMLQEAEEVAIHVDDISSVSPELNGKLIHANAMTQTKDLLKDVTFGVEEVAVKLEREVNYYQWVEHTQTKTKDKIGGGKEEITTYTYEQKWVPSPVNSNNFKDKEYQKKNYVAMNVKSEKYIAENVTFGAYLLPKSMISSISGSVPVELHFKQEVLDKWNTDFKTTINRVKRQTLEEGFDILKEGLKSIIKKDSIDGENKTRDTLETTPQFIHVNGNVLYWGKNPSMPEIGDMKVTFTKVLPREASVIAQVNGNKLQSYTAKNGKTLSVLTMGNSDMNQMFQSEHKGNNFMTWIWRIVGLLLVISGFKGIFGIIITLLKVLPFLADIVGLGVGFICNILGFSWSLLIVAIAWIFYRPILAIGLLIVMVALIIFLIKKGKDKKRIETNPA